MRGSFPAGVWVLLAAAGFVTPRVAAQDANDRGVQGIVHTLESHFHTAATLKATFLERYAEGSHPVRVESGTVYFRRPGRMRWEYESPEQKLFIADGKTVWFYVPADRTVSRAPMKQSADWRTPLALLAGKAHLAKLCGRIERASSPPGAGAVPAGHVVLRCTPRGEKARSKGSTTQDASTLDRSEDNFLEVLLEVDTAAGELARLLILQPGGMEIEYRFGAWQRNIALSEAMFHFQAPPGVAIVDESALNNTSR